MKKIKVIIKTCRSNFLGNGKTLCLGIRLLLLLRLKLYKNEIYNTISQQALKWTLLQLHILFDRPKKNGSLSSNSQYLLSKSESVEFSLIESVICLFTDSSVQKYFSLTNHLIFTDWINEKIFFTVKSVDFRWSNQWNLTDLQ